MSHRAETMVGKIKAPNRAYQTPWRKKWDESILIIIKTPRMLKNHQQIFAELKFAKLLCSKFSKNLMTGVGEMSILFPKDVERIWIRRRTNKEACRVIEKVDWYHHFFTWRVPYLWELRDFVKVSCWLLIISKQIFPLNMEKDSFWPYFKPFIL